ncbi:flagellar biosynthetic protein FliR [Tranquillimonas rosea]|uniref:flagellar biosynthetic protein FliR n=1 Tax=Tranquillimonas rosea TaxID=641238 RepID=UPI003BABF4F2
METMFEAANRLIGPVQDGLALGGVVFLRIGAAMAVLPAFGDRMVPARVRLVAALMFTLIVAPALAPVLALGPRPPWLRLLATETIAGLSLGAAVRLFVIVLQTAGSMAAQSTSLAQIFGGANVEPLPAIGHVMVIGGLALAAMTGLHVKIVEYFLLSYDLMPAGVLPFASDLMPWGIARVSQAFALAFTLAAPFLIASMIYNVALGVINKAMPQLMVAFVGAPAITAGALILLALSLPAILELWAAALDRFLANPARPP